MRGFSFFHSLPATTRGICWMLLSGVFMTLLATMIRMLLEDLPPFQVVFLRNLAAFAVILPIVWPQYQAVIYSRHKKAHIWRSLSGIAAMMLWIHALAILHLAEAITISFTTPLFATIGAILFLREQVGPRRWSAMIIGFGGVLIMLRPDSGTIDHGAWLALASAGFMAISVLLVKHLAGRDPIPVALLYMTGLMSLFSLPSALWHWQPLLPAHWMLLAGIGLSATISHFALARAFALAEASAMMPYDFIRLPLAALLGWWLYDEVLDEWGMMGAVIIVISSLYVGQREARLARASARRALETAEETRAIP